MLNPCFLTHPLTKANKSSLFLAHCCAPVISSFSGAFIADPSPGTWHQAPAYGLIEVLDSAAEMQQQAGQLRQYEWTETISSELIATHDLP